MSEPAGVGGKGPQLIGVLWFQMALSYFLIGLRLYTRAFIKGAIGVDDWCLIATAVSTSFRAPKYIQLTLYTARKYHVYCLYDHSMHARNGSTPRRPCNVRVRKGNALYPHWPSLYCPRYWDG